MSFEVVMMAGDGIGKEITDNVRRVFAAAEVPVSWIDVGCGLTHFEKTGALIDPKYEEVLKTTKVALKGPTTTPLSGGHKSINVMLRQKFDLFANIRPIKIIPGLDCKYSSIDFVTIRENTEDLYMGIEYMIGNDIAHGIKVITRPRSKRISEFAFDYAVKMNRKKVTVVHKSNIMKLTDGLFREAFFDVARSYDKIEAQEVLVDNCCMQMVTRPEQFDVLVTENLYGDIISDLASGLVGGLGVAAGANIGQDIAIFEAVHGSAPDIAGKDLANPTAILKSSIMLLEHLGLNVHAQKISEALDKTLGSKSTRTKDLGGVLGGKNFTETVISNLK
jgi:isocitrate dehydrogenase (NAD+)